MSCPDLSGRPLRPVSRVHFLYLYPLKELYEMFFVLTLPHHVWVSRTVLLQLLVCDSGIFTVLAAATVSHLDSNCICSLYRGKDAKTREYFEKVFPEVRKQRELKERFRRYVSQNSLLPHLVI